MAWSQRARFQAALHEAPLGVPMRRKLKVGRVWVFAKEAFISCIFLVSQILFLMS